MTDKKQEEPDRVRDMYRKEIVRVKEKKKKLQDRLREVNENPEGFIKKRIDSIDEKLPNLKYHETGKGKICMKEHLENLKKELENNPSEFVSKEKNRLERRIDRSDEFVSEMEDKM